MHFDPYPMKVTVLLKIHKSRKLQVVFKFGKQNIMIKCSVKSKSLTNPTKLCANDKLKESFSKET